MTRDPRVGDKVESQSTRSLGIVLAIEADGTNAVVKFDDHPVARAVAVSDLKVIDAGD
jgi:hypothetical protein